MTATDKATCSYDLTDKTFSFTPNASDGGIKITVVKAASTFIDITLNFDATITYNTVSQPVTFAVGAASAVINFTGNGLSFTPQKGDGTLNLTLSNLKSGGSMNINVEVLSGSFVPGENGAINVNQNTELQLDFGNDYKVKFKTTDDAGGSLSLDDGGLELTITANTNASSSIFFDPTNGLTITPTTPDALTVVLTEDGADIIIEAVNGTISYSGGGRHASFFDA